MQLLGWIRLKIIWQVQELIKYVAEKENVNLSKKLSFNSSEMLWKIVGH
jgi:hypothetical protein